MAEDTSSLMPLRGSTHRRGHDDPAYQADRSRKLLAFLARMLDVQSRQLRLHGDDQHIQGFKLTSSGKLIPGELEDILAGAGGGGGGDSSNTSVFPQVPFNPAGDEKGATFSLSFSIPL